VVAPSGRPNLTIVPSCSFIATDRTFFLCQHGRCSNDTVVIEISAVSPAGELLEIRDSWTGCDSTEVPPDWRTGLLWRDAATTTAAVGDGRKLRGVTGRKVRGVVGC
jgi:hypothetical protein